MAFVVPLAVLYGVCAALLTELVLLFVSCGFRV